VGPPSQRPSAYTGGAVIPSSSECVGRGSRDKGGTLPAGTSSPSPWPTGTPPAAGAAASSTTCPVVHCVRRGVGASSTAMPQFGASPALAQFPATSRRCGRRASRNVITKAAVMTFENQNGWVDGWPALVWSKLCRCRADKSHGAVRLLSGLQGPPENLTLYTTARPYTDIPSHRRGADRRTDYRLQHVTPRSEGTNRWHHLRRSRRAVASYFNGGSTACFVRAQYASPEQRLREMTVGRRRHALALTRSDPVGGGRLLSLQPGSRGPCPQSRALPASWAAWARGSGKIVQSTHTRQRFRTRRSEGLMPRDQGHGPGLPPAPWTAPVSDAGDPSWAPCRRTGSSRRIVPRTTGTAGS